MRNCFASASADALWPPPVSADKKSTLSGLAVFYKGIIQKQEKKIKLVCLFLHTSIPSSKQQ